MPAVEIMPTTVAAKAPRLPTCPSCGLPADAAGPSGYTCRNNHRWPRSSSQTMAAEAEATDQLKAHAAARAAQQAQPAKARGYVTLSDVDSYYGHVSWAWPTRIPAGHVTMIAGEQGTGKSYLLARLIAVFTGALSTWPDGVSYQGQTGAALVADTEEMRGIYAERLTAMGVRDDSVLFPSPKDDPTYLPRLPRDLRAMEGMAQAQQCTVVVIDSLSGGHALDENSAAMRTVLQGIVGMAGRLQVPVLVAHLARKRSQFETARMTLDRIRGSTTISQFCRSVIGLYRPGESDLTGPVRAETLKSTFCRPPAAFGFTITDTGLDFHEAPEPPRQETPLDRAKELLGVELRRQPQRYSDLLAAAEAAGVSRNTLYRAREVMGITVVDGLWSLPIPK